MRNALIPKSPELKPTTLLYENPGDTAPKGRLLLLSWHFPPGMAAGALRWQKLATHARENGWSIDAVTASPEDPSSVEPARFQDLPKGTRVFGVSAHRTFSELVDDQLARQVKRTRPSARPVVAKASEDSAAAHEMRWRASRSDLARHWNAWVSFARDRAWARAAAESGGRLLSSEHRAVVSCGPPHFVHVEAAELAVRRSLPFVMDLRDPWTLRRRLPASLATPLVFALADRYEVRAVDRASLIVANTTAVASAMQKRYPRSRILTVMNGFDDDNTPDDVVRQKFRMVYAGAIYLDRDPRPLLRAVARVIKQLELRPEEFSLEFFGRVAGRTGTSLRDLAVEAGIPQFVHHEGHIPRADLLRALAGAAVLVSLPQDSAYAIPSKVFEYMSFKSWLLVFAEPLSPTYELLKGSAADLVSWRDEGQVARTIERRVGQWRLGQRPAALASSNGSWSRRSQAAILFEAIDNVAGAGI